MVLQARCDYDSVIDAGRFGATCKRSAIVATQHGSKSKKDGCVTRPSAIDARSKSYRSMPHEHRDGGVVEDVARGPAEDEFSEARAAEAAHDQQIGPMRGNLREQLRACVAARTRLDLLDI